MEEIWTIGKLLSWTTDYFAKKAISSARLDAELLLANLLGCDRIYLYVNFDRPLLADELAGYRAVVKRRAAKEPLAYILGNREFYKLSLVVTPAVLIPRPDTEILVASAIEHAKANDAKRAIDLGTGSGAIAISLLKNLLKLSITASDLSIPALEIARINARRHLVEHRLQFVVSDWFENIALEKYDIIVSNPPYIELTERGKLQSELQYEPQTALYADNDGLGCYRTILTQAHEYLAGGGKIFLEVGFNQASAVAEIAKSTNNYGAVHFVKDYSGIDRVVVIAAAG